MHRLRTINPELFFAIEQASEAACRAAAIAAARLALSLSGVTDPAFESLLSSAEQGSVGDSDQRRSVEVLVQKLDDEQWAMQDLMDDGGVDEEDHGLAFAKARAASAAFFAAEADARAGALEGIYEAVVSTGDEALLLRVVWQIIPCAGHSCG